MKKKITIKQGYGLMKKTSMTPTIKGEKTIYDLLDSKLMESLTDEQYRAIEDFVFDVFIPQQKGEKMKRNKKVREEFMQIVRNNWHSGAGEIIDTNKFFAEVLEWVEKALQEEREKVVEEIEKLPMRSKDEETTILRVIEVINETKDETNT